MPALLRQPAAASALEQTETALAAAEDAYERARLASMDADADAAALRSGEGGVSKVTPADLAEPDAGRPRRVGPSGRRRCPPRVSAAVAAAKADAAADESCRRCRGRGATWLALSGLEEALVPVLAAAGTMTAMSKRPSAIFTPWLGRPRIRHSPTSRHRRGAARPSLRLPGLTTQCQLLRRSSPQVVRPGSCSRGSAIQESTDST